MTAPFLNFVVLYCLHTINGERTIYSIYHLLYGKKSSQTIQDAHFFQLTKFFGIYRILSRQQFEDIIKELEKINLIVKTANDTYIPTTSGVDLVQSGQKEGTFLSHLNGWKFQNADVFWERLSLLIQVSSHLNQNDSKYVPIQRNKIIQSWLKSFLQTNRFKREKLSKMLYEELMACFDEQKDISPAVLVIRLTGYHTIGLTEKQACETLGIEPTLYHFQFCALLHSIMKNVQNNGTSFPLLSFAVKDLQKKYLLTESTQKTLGLLQKGFTVEEIGRIRKLKNNTIQDHIVELSLQIDEFDISKYVDREKINRIMEAINRTSSKQLRQIRELVPDASYFEIRLVMTKYGEIV